MPRVLNFRDLKDGIPENAVRVDRKSRWGNHHSMRNASDKERDRVCNAFERSVRMWPPDRIRAMKSELRGKDLVCWCAPKRCHADTLLRIANEPDQPT